MIAVRDMQKKVHLTACQHGWWNMLVVAGLEVADPNSRPMPEQLMLMVSEFAEALEEYRKYDIHETWFMIDGERKVVSNVHECLTLAMQGHKPEGFFVELADAVIRIMDTCEANAEQLEWFMNLKDAYNKTRPYRHGGKKC